MRRSDVSAVTAVAMLLLLTAWGNALGMMVVSAIACVLGLLVFRGSLLRDGRLMATVVSAAAVAFSIAMMLGK